ncbi:MAG: hypothetical protein HY815_16345 [Candidatus Riflebacteria bacterium]|nr:hypothetical protein [Candidatus Riflebacteria bacterium]
MTTNKLYAAFGALILLVFFYVQYTGWSFQSVDETKGVPRTVRQNPGVYRSHYHHYVYMGGK